MKKKWSEPLLEILEVNQTMAGTDYQKFDGNFSNGQQIPVNGQGQPLIGTS